MSSFKFFVNLAVCLLVILDEQLCTSHAQDTVRSRIDSLETIPRRENATEPHRLCGTCPDCLSRDDYQDLFPMGSYKMHTRAATWADARNICREECAHLAIINSKAEAIVLSTKLSQMGHARDAVLQKRAFIGIHDQFKEGEWVTVLDDSIYTTGFTSWSDKWGGQPDNYGEQDCGTLMEDGELDDMGCDGKLAFICEKAHPSLCE